MEKKCIHCGKKIIGRSDKKFCNESCKNDYHNFCNSRKPAFIKLQNAAAKRNRSLLHQFENAGIGEMSTGELEQSGFSFEGITGIQFTAGENLLLFCFEYMLQKNGNSFTIQKAYAQ